MYSIFVKQKTRWVLVYQKPQASSSVVKQWSNRKTMEICWKQFFFSNSWALNLWWIEMLWTRCSKLWPNVQSGGLTYDVHPKVFSPLGSSRPQPLSSVLDVQVALSMMHSLLACLLSQSCTWPLSRFRASSPAAARASVDSKWSGITLAVEKCECVNYARHV